MQPATLYWEILLIFHIYVTSLICLEINFFLRYMDKGGITKYPCNICQTFQVVLAYRFFISLLCILLPFMLFLHSDCQALSLIMLTGASSSCIPLLEGPFCKKNWQQVHGNLFRRRFVFWPLSVPLNFSPDHHGLKANLNTRVRSGNQEREFLIRLFHIDHGPVICKSQPHQHHSPIAYNHWLCTVLIIPWSQQTSVFYHTAFPCNSVDCTNTSLVMSWLLNPNVTSSLVMSLAMRCNQHCS